MRVTTLIVRRSLLGATAVAAMAALAWGGAPALAADLPEVTRSSGSGAPTTFGAPMYVAEAMGFFAKEGIRLREVYVKGDANAMRAMITKDVLVGGGGPTTVFSAILEGAKMKAFLSPQPVVDYNMVAKKGMAKSLADIKNATFASAGPMDMTTEVPKMVLKKNGIDPSGLRIIQVGGHAARLQAIIAGRVQASMVNTLTATQGRLNGDIDVISTVSKDFPGLGYVYLTALDEDLANPAQRKLLKAFVKGTILGARFMMENPGKTAEIMSKLLSSTDPVLMEAVFKQLNADGVWPVNGGVERHITEFTIQVQKDMGELKSDLKVDQVLDTSLADEVVREIGPYKGKSS